MAATNMPSSAVLGEWNTLQQALDWAGVSRDEWVRLATVMGDADLDSLLLISAIDDGDFTEARTEAKFTIVRRAAIDLLFAVVKTKFNVTTKVIPTATPAPAGPPATAADAQLGTPTPIVTAMGAQSPQQQTGGVTGSVRINLGQVLNQAMNQEVPLLPESEI